MWAKIGPRDAECLVSADTYLTHKQAGVLDVGLLCCQMKSKWVDGTVCAAMQTSAVRLVVSLGVVSCVQKQFYLLARLNQGEQESKQQPVD